MKGDLFVEIASVMVYPANNSLQLTSKIVEIKIF